MGHICENRTVQHPIQHTNDFEDTLIEWIETFLAPEFPNMVARWETRKIAPFAGHIRVSFFSNSRKNFKYFARQFSKYVLGNHGKNMCTQQW